MSRRDVKKFAYCIGSVKVAAGVRACVLRESKHLRGPTIVAERRSRWLLHEARYHIPYRRPQRKRLRSRHTSQVAARLVAWYDTIYINARLQ